MATTRQELCQFFAHFSFSCTQRKPGEFHGFGNAWPKTLRRNMAPIILRAELASAAASIVAMEL